ncbi:MAG: hypothetical protein ACSLE1_11120 [Sphingobium sp.]
MTDDNRVLATNLLQRALDETDHPLRAVSVLMSGAATILQRLVGDEAAIDLMTASLDEIGAQMRHARAH